MTIKKSEKHPIANDAVIADFFKRSLKIIAAMILITAGLVYYFTQEKKKEIIIEEAYQAPKKLSHNIEPPKTLFVEQAKQRGIGFIPENGATGERMLPETMGQGVAFVDYDNDGDQDIIFANGTNWAWNHAVSPAPTQHVYENDGKGYFTDVSDQMGLNKTFYGTGIAIGDVNNDGYDDIFIAAVGTNHLYINQKGQTFIESKVVLDCTVDGWSTSSGFFDYDNDGDLDLMVLNYIQWSKELDLAADYKIDGIGRAYGPPSNFPGTHNCLFENKGNGNFDDVTQASGIVVKNPATGEFEGKSLALIFIDVNEDGFQDVIVANDTTKNFVFINQKDKTFKEQGAEIGLAYNASGKATGAMGLDAAYYKNNKDVAVTIGNFANEMTSFYVNRSNLGFFTDESVITGVGPKSRQALSFGLFFFDYDLDGRLDFFQTNGHVENDINKVQAAQHYAQKSQLFWNCGEDCERTYMPIEDAGDLTRIDLVGRAASYADVDNDGDLDIVVTQVARAPKLFINESKHGDWIGLRFKSNNPIVGVEIQLTVQKEKQNYINSVTKSYLSQVPKDLILGINNKNIDSITVKFQNKQIKLIPKINEWNVINFDN
jgi:hypothetical protein